MGKTEDADRFSSETIPPYQDDMEIKIDGMRAEEYVTKITEEMNQIEFHSIPLDKWDMIVTFSLALTEIAGDFLIADPGVQNSLASKNGPLVQWMKEAHDNPPSWLAHPNNPLDYQGSEVSGSKGAHRAMTFGHDLLCFPLGILSLWKGAFIDCRFTPEGVYELIVSNVNSMGNPYHTLPLGQAVIAYSLHMLADFCSAASLPIPGFSLLTHFPNRAVEAFALKLYKNGMNLRTLLLGGIPVAITEFLMWVYVALRYNDSEYSESQIKHKREKLLSLAHGIASAVNVGKVIITENPARLNLIMIARTIYLVWSVLKEEASLTNKAIEKLDMGIVRASVQSLQTLKLLDETIYRTEQFDRIVAESINRIHNDSENERLKQENFNSAIEQLKAKL